MIRLYKQCFNDENIIKAIKYIKWYYTNFNLIGKDNIGYTNDLNINTVIKNVKLLLRKRKKIGYITSDKHIQLNFYDLVAHRCIYQIIQSIIDPQMSNYNYALRKNNTIKYGVCKLADSMTHKKEIYALKFDLKKYFHDVSLDELLRNLYQYKIRDKLLILAIRHLLFYKEIEGVESFSGSSLENLIYNCYMDKIDRFMEQSFELQKVKTHYTRDYAAHKNNWIEWQLKRKRLIYCRYYRNLFECLIIVDNKEEQEYIKNKLDAYLFGKNIIINKLFNKVSLDKFLLKKSLVDNKAVWIRVNNPREILNIIKQFNFNNRNECIQFLHWFRDFLKIYDIVNDLSYILSMIYDRMYYRSKRKISYLNKKDGKYFFGKPKTYIDIYEMRALSKTSFKDYLQQSTWLIKRELLKLSEYANEYRSFIWILWTKQRGLDKITNKPLDIDNIHIHHILPISKGGMNELNNLILLSSETHKQLHYDKMPDIRFEKYRKYLR